MGFEYKKGVLHLVQGKQSLSLLELAKNIRQPFYVYDLRGIMKRLQLFKKSTSPARIHYAVKANPHPVLLKSIAQAGGGADIVSGGELKLALQAGFLPQSIVFSGVGKTEAELKKAIRACILQINVESLSELKCIARLAGKLRIRTPVAFRINPDVNAKTHPYITTGLKENKFGMDKALLPDLLKVVCENRRHLKLKGLAMHIGSQMRSLQPFKMALKNLTLLYKRLNQSFPLQTLDVGGGLGLDYTQPPGPKEIKFIQEYGRILKHQTRGLKARILTEPGRVITARFSVLTGQVQYLKAGKNKNFAILNTGMHHLMRPCLYQAYHRILPVENKKGPAQIYDVVGPVCESADTLAFDRSFKGLKEKDFLAVMDTGAYGATMASRYNTHPFPKEIFVHSPKKLSIKV